jgi:hypothetical protein
MKKLLHLLLAISLIGFISCEKNVPETPGKIPGLGNTPGEIQIKKAFVMPEGINVLGEVSGLDNPVAKDELKPLLFNDSKTAAPHYASGCVVRLKLTVLNTKNHPRTVFFPKGLIFKCINNNYQHGLTCQTFWVTLAPNEKRTIYIDLYCLQLGIPAPDQDGKYAIWGVTDSRVLWDLLDKIGWRKINFEWIYRNLLSKGPMQEGPSYEEITTKLQTMVHNLTNNGIPLSAEDEAFLNSIPEIAIEDRPVVDSNSQFPEYFEELLVPEK